MSISATSVKKFCNDLFNNCYIPTWEYREHNLFADGYGYWFACRIAKNGLQVETYSSQATWDFLLNARVKTIECFAEDSAHRKTYKAFFRTFRWIEYTITYIRDVRPVIRNNLLPSQKAEIRVLCDQVNEEFKAQKIARRNWGKKEPTPGAGGLILSKMV